MKAVRLLEYGGQLVIKDVPTSAIARDKKRRAPEGASLLVGLF
jgi:hypothetical protein